MNVRFKIRKEQLICILLILPYFELYSITMLESKGYAIFVFIGKLFTISRILIDIYVFLKFVRRRKLPYTITGRYLCLYCLLGFVLGFYHNTVTVKGLLGLMNHISIVLLLDHLIYKWGNRLLEPLLLFWGALSMIGGISIVFFPFGFLRSAYTDDAIYFLGSKNGSGEYFLVFLLLLNLMRIIKSEKNRAIDFAVTAFFIFCVRICNSANSIICLTIILSYMLITRVWRKAVEYINVRLVIGAVLAFVLMITVNRGLPSIFNNIIGRMGKDVGLTGRIILWNQAVSYFVANPLVGSGGNVTYYINSIKTEPHAHNWYLDSLAKAGVFTLTVFIAAIGRIVGNIVKKDKGMLRGLKCVFLATFLLHIGLEDLGIPFIAIILMVIESVHVREA